MTPTSPLPLPPANETCLLIALILYSSSGVGKLDVEANRHAKKLSPHVTRIPLKSHSLLTLTDHYIFTYLSRRICWARTVLENNHATSSSLNPTDLTDSGDALLELIVKIAILPSQPPDSAASYYYISIEQPFYLGPLVQIAN